MRKIDASLDASIGIGSHLACTNENNWSWDFDGSANFMQRDLVYK